MSAIPYLSDAEFMTNARSCGNNLQTALRIAADACHDHMGNAGILLNPADATSSLLDHLDKIDTVIRGAAAKTTEPAFGTVVPSFLSKNGLPTGAIHSYLKNSGHYKSAQVLLRTAGRDLSAIYQKLAENGVTAAIVDSYTMNPYKYQFGGAGFTHFDTITTRMDAASKITDIPAGAATKDPFYYTRPFVVSHFYGGYTHEYMIGTDGSNIIKVTPPATGPLASVPIYVTTPKEFSVNEINRSLGLSPPRKMVGSAAPAIKFYKDSATGPEELGVVAMTSAQKADSLLVKQITDYGQFYQATYLSRVAQADGHSKKTVLFTVDKYFVDIMESCQELQGGFVVIMDKKENTLICLNPEYHIDPNAQRGAIFANLLALIPSSAAGVAQYTIAEDGMISSLSDILTEQLARIDTILKMNDIYHDPFTYVFHLELKYLEQEVSGYIQYINSVITNIITGALTLANFHTFFSQDDKLKLNNLSIQTVEQVAAGIVDRAINIIEEYNTLYKSILELRRQILKNEISEDEFAEKVVGDIHDFVMNRQFKTEINPTLRLILIGIWLSYIETKDKDYTINKTSIYNELGVLDATHASQSAYLFANRIHYAVNTMVSIYNFFSATDTMQDSTPTKLKSLDVGFVKIGRQGSRPKRGAASGPDKIGGIDLLSDAVPDIGMGETYAKKVYDTPVATSTGVIQLIIRRKITKDYIATVYNTIVPDNRILSAGEVLVLKKKAELEAAAAVVAETKIVRKKNKKVGAAASTDSEIAERVEVERAARAVINKARRLKMGDAVDEVRKALGKPPRVSQQDKYRKMKGIPRLDPLKTAEKRLKKALDAAGIKKQGGGGTEGTPTTEPDDEIPQDALDEEDNAYDTHVPDPDALWKQIDMIDPTNTTYALEDEASIRKLMEELPTITTFPEYFSWYLSVADAISIDAEKRGFFDDYSEKLSNLLNLYYLFAAVITDASVPTDKKAATEIIMFSELSNHTFNEPKFSQLFEAIPAEERHKMSIAMINCLSKEAFDLLIPEIERYMTSEDEDIVGAVRELLSEESPSVSANVAPALSIDELLKEQAQLQAFIRSKRLSGNSSEKTAALTRLEEVFAKIAALRAKLSAPADPVSTSSGKLKPFGAVQRGISNVAAAAAAETLNLKKRWGVYESTSGSGSMYSEKERVPIRRGGSRRATRSRRHLRRTRRRTDKSRRKRTRKQNH